jgi:hypothetical protein
MAQVPEWPNPRGSGSCLHLPVERRGLDVVVVVLLQRMLALAALVCNTLALLVASGERRERLVEDTGLQVEEVTRDRFEIVRLFRRSGACREPGLSLLLSVRRWPPRDRNHFRSSLLRSTTSPM